MLLQGNQIVHLFFMYSNISLYRIKTVKWRKRWKIIISSDRNAFLEIYETHLYSIF